MYKIFKYEVDPETRLACMPKGIPLRVDYVDDGFYKGHFVWSIVDVDDHEKYEQHFPDVSWSKAPPPESFLNVPFFPLKVKEKQEIFTYGEPFFAKEGDGVMNVYLKRGDYTRHEIAVYKTGQEIDLPIENLTYLGLNRLWIIQELGLYTFLVKTPKPKMQYNECKCCGAKDGRAGNLFTTKHGEGLCENCHDTAVTGNMVIHAHLSRTPEEFAQQCALLSPK